MVLGWKRPGRVWICQAIVASLAQSVEHAAVNRSVVGSSPTQGAKILYLNIMARWLSWLERRPVTAEVVGSSPIRVVT